MGASNISGAVSETVGITLDDIAREDRMRALAHDYQQRRTRARKGAAWGFATIGGKRTKKSRRK